MEIGIPTYQSSSQSYAFRIVESSIKVVNLQFYEGSQTQLTLPVKPDVSEAFVQEFLGKTTKYFSKPLETQKVLRHLRHTSLEQNYPKEVGMYALEWVPSVFVIKTGDFELQWKIASCKPQDLVIPPEFTASTTPGNQSPVPEQASQELRKIQIHDILVPVGDLPLSDLSPLSFGTDTIDPRKEAIRRRIQEARLKLALAKLKAQRMEQKYFERYGQTLEEAEGSSEFSSDSEEEEELSFENHSH